MISSQLPSDLQVIIVQDFVIKNYNEVDSTNNPTLSEEQGGEPHHGPANTQEEDMQNNISWNCGVLLYALFLHGKRYNFGPDLPSILTFWGWYGITAYFSVLCIASAVPSSWGRWLPVLFLQELSFCSVSATTVGIIFKTSPHYLPFYNPFSHHHIMHSIIMSLDLVLFTKLPPFNPCHAIPVLLVCAAYAIVSWLYCAIKCPFRFNYTSSEIAILFCYWFLVVAAGINLAFFSGFVISKRPFHSLLHKMVAHVKTRIDV